MLPKTDDTSSGMVFQLIGNNSEEFFFIDAEYPKLKVVRTLKNIYVGYWAKLDQILTEEASSDQSSAGEMGPFAHRPI